MTISSPVDQMTRVFTPNYSYDDKNSFLPETSWNLKADEVDSSHCNNNAIGAFVNDNQTPIGGVDNNARNDEHFGEHVKNCLTGFPCLVFLAYNDQYDVNSQPELGNCKIYYLGIYNFNMNRDAYFNLGYYNNDGKSFPDEFSQLDDNGSNTFQIIDYVTS